MPTPTTSARLLLDGWYSDADLAALVCERCPDPTCGCQSEIPIEARNALIQALRVFSRRAADLAEAYGVGSGAALALVSPRMQTWIYAPPR